MKKLPIIALLFLASCAQYDAPPASEPFNFLGENMRTFEYEGCQYIIIGAGSLRMMSHKGNCSNPIHICKCN